MTPSGAPNKVSMVCMMHFNNLSHQHTNIPLTANPVLTHNVGSVLWRLFSTLEIVQYIGGCSVHRGDNISTVVDSFSTVEG